jgi:hypothetical protein
MIAADGNVDGRLAGIPAEDEQNAERKIKLTAQQTRNVRGKTTSEPDDTTCYNSK